MTVVLQKAVTPAQVQAFLNEGFDRIGGYMVRAGEVSDVTAVADLRRLHHTDYEGSPFAGDGPLHILHVDRSPSWQLVPASKMVERDVMSTSGTVEVNEQLVEVLFLDHTRLTNGARLWRFEEGETPVLVATYLGPAYGWQDHSAGGALKTGTPYPSTGALAVVEEKAFVADVISGDDGVPTSITAVAAVDPGGDLGFSQNDVGLWVRAFEHAELSALFELRVTATWNDLPVLVVQVFRMPDGSRAQRIFSIARDWERARAAGLTELELGVWEANVSADEVTNVGPQEVAAQPWMTEKQKERVAKAQAASRQNVLKDGAGAGGAGGTLGARGAGGAGRLGGFAPDPPSQGAQALGGQPVLRPVPGSEISDTPGAGDATHVALYERIAKGVLPHIPQGATQAQVLCQSVGNVMELAAQATLPDGETKPLPQISQDVARAFGELRVLSPTTGEGPWFGALVTMTSDGKLTINFNRETQPRLQRGVTAEMLRTERERFPRDTWPQWFTDLEAEIEAGE